MKPAGHCLAIVHLIGFLPRSWALQGWPQQGTIVQGSAVQFTQAKWEANLAKPNATGNYSVNGFDITQKYPSKQIDGWELSVNITGSIPDSQTQTTDNSTGKAYTGTSIFLKAPDSVSGSITSNQSATLDTTWKICVTVMDNGPSDAAAAATENGTCGALSAQCIADFQSAMADQFSKEQDCYKMPPIPSSCGSSISAANMTTQQFPLNSANGTEIFATASGAHDAGDNSVLANAAKQVWPVVTVWGYNVRAKVPDGTKPTVQLSCVRANTATQGSTVSAAPSSHGSATIAFVIAGLMAMMLL